MSKITGKQILKIIRQLSGTDLQILHIHKNGSNTCWAGCYRMIDVHYKNSPVYRRYLKLVNPSCSSAGCEIKPCYHCDQIRLKKDVLTDLISLGYRHSSRHTSHLQTGEISDHLLNGRPLIAFKDFGTETGHYVLISGITHKYFLRNTVLTINDPDKYKMEFIDSNDFCLKNGYWTETWIPKI